MVLSRYAEIFGGVLFGSVGTTFLFKNFPQLNSNNTNLTISNAETIDHSPNESPSSSIIPIIDPQQNLLLSNNKDQVLVSIEELSNLTSNMMKNQLIFSGINIVLMLLGGCGKLLFKKYKSSTKGNEIIESPKKQVSKVEQINEKIKVPIVVNKTYGSECYNYETLLAELNSKCTKYSFELISNNETSEPHLKCEFFFKDSRDLNTTFDDSILYIVNSKISESLNRPKMFVCAHTKSMLELKSLKNLEQFLESNFINL